MSETAACWFALPVHRLTPVHRQAVTRLLGMRPEELDDLYAQETDHPLGFAVEDDTGLFAVDGTTCLVWRRSRAFCAGEWDALHLQEQGIPYLRWWGSCDAFGPASEVFIGTGEPITVVCDRDLQPVVPIAVWPRLTFDREAVQSIRAYLHARQRLLRRS